MILTITANPLLDRMLELEPSAVLSAGDSGSAGRTIAAGIYRGRRVYELAGGKGINASRALHRLGQATCATGFLGGYVGRRVRELLDEEGIPHAFVDIAATTRAGVTLVRPGEPLLAFYDPPPRVLAREVEHFLDGLPELLSRADLVVVAGSLPSQCPVDLYSRIIARCHQAGIPTLLDTYGEAVRQAITAAPTLLKINRVEWRELRPRDTVTREWMSQHGLRGVVITDGPRPVEALIDGRRYRIFPPTVREINALGSGDCVAAVLAMGLVAGWSPDDMLVRAVAAGAANAEIWDPARIDADRVQALVQETRLVQLEG